MIISMELTLRIEPTNGIIYTIKRYDVIKRPMNMIPGKYHFGIILDVGNNNKIISVCEFTNDSIVRDVDLGTFLGDNCSKCFIKSTTLSADKLKKIKLNMEDRHRNRGKYDLLNNNCEDFVNHMLDENVIDQANTTNISIGVGLETLARTGNPILAAGAGLVSDIIMTNLVNIDEYKEYDIIRQYLW